MEAKLWNRTFVLLLAFEFLAQAGANLINPIVSNYAVWMGASYAVAGFLAGINSFVSFVVRPLAGMALRRFLRRRILIIASLAFFVSAMLCTFVVTVPALGIQRLVYGIAFVFKSALVVAFASTVVPKEKLGQGVGYIGLANIVGGAIGPFAASAITSTMGYPFDCGVAVAVFALQTLIIFAIKDPQEELQKESFARLKESTKGMTKLQVLLSELRPSSMFHLKTVPLAITLAIQAFCYGTVLMFILLISEERGTTGGAYFFVVYAIVCLVSRPFTSRLYDRFGFAKIFLPECALMIIAFILLAYADSIPSFVVASAILALGHGSIYPCLQSEGVRGRSAQESPMAVNTLYLGADVGMFVGPLVSGIILEVSTSAAVMWVNALVAAIFTVSLVFYVRWRAKDDAGSNGDEQAPDSETPQ